jgi:hypothetical protein
LKTKSNGSKKKEEKLPELRVSHIGLGYLGNDAETATKRVQRAGYFDPRDTQTGAIYVFRRRGQTIPLELIDVGLPGRGEEPLLGWDYSTEFECFTIFTTNPQQQGEILVKLFGFKKSDKKDSDEFYLGGLKIRLLQSNKPAKWHLAMYNAKGQDARTGFMARCSKQVSKPGDIFAQISDMFAGTCKELPKGGIFKISVPEIPGFSIEVMFGKHSLKCHALEANLNKPKDAELYW